MQLWRHSDSVRRGAQVGLGHAGAPMRHSSAAARHLAALPPAEVLYADLDGTLLGPGGSLLTGPDGGPSARAAQALVDARAAGITVVPVTGRRALALDGDTRLLGLRDYIAEVGTVILRAGRRRYEWGSCPADLRAAAATPRAALDSAGALDVLLAAFPGDLRPFLPWDADREGGHLLHGRVDVAVANAALSAQGLGWAYLVDNGAAGGWPGRRVRAYHLLPRGVGKAVAVADDLAERGLAAGQAAACGDSLEDLTMAGVVGTYFQVANGHGEPGGNAFGVPGAMGHGFADAVALLVAARGR